MAKSKLPSQHPESRSLSFITVKHNLTAMLKFYQAESVHIKAEYDRARLNRQYSKRSFYAGQRDLCNSITLDLISVIDDL